MPIFPEFKNGWPFYASQVDVLSEYLTDLKAIADRPRPVTSQHDIPAAGLTGYIQHQYTTLEVQTGDSCTIYYDNNNLGSANGSATFSLSGLGLVVGQVYQVRVEGAGNTIQYFAERYTPSFPTLPTFVNGGPVVSTVELGQLTAAASELINFSNYPYSMFHQIDNDNVHWEKDEDSEFTVYTGYSRHVGNTVHLRLKHRAVALSGGPNGTSSHRSKIVLKIDGQTAWGQVMGNDTVSTLTANLSHEGGNSRHYKTERIEGYIDISSLSLTLGEIYKWEITQKGTGTSKAMDLSTEIYFLANSASGAWSDLPLWEEGEKNITAERLNLYKTAITALHPDSGSPSAPMYYDNHAQWATGRSHRWGHKTKKYLLYVWDGDGTAAIVAAPGSGLGVKSNLRNESGVRAADLDRIRDMYYGDMLHVDDTYCAILTDDISQYSA